MREVVWFVLLAVAGGFGYWLWRLGQRWQERSRAAEERFATLMAQARPSAPAAIPVAIPAPILAVPPADLSQQKLLLDAAAQAGEAGGAGLFIPLYARPLARYPQTSFARPARAAAEARKEKLPKPEDSSYKPP